MTLAVVHLDRRTDVVHLCYLCSARRTMPERRNGEKGKKLSPNVDVSVYVSMLAEMRPTHFVQLSPSQRTHELLFAMFSFLILLIVCGGVHVNG